MLKELIADKVRKNSYSVLLYNDRLFINFQTCELQRYYFSTFHVLLTMNLHFKKTV